ncbi:nitrogenase iron-molybdenum cofactor biosynthesis protein NifN [Methylocystis sp. MJC1]|uniref:nitrogenase iron-molybdenum cofactor biosynthesis protein NifN n=1 Tax=Methylocystis sp. MJC1 TaxID=2654282 RepID=UPI0013ECF521|nr:nitrogenase iron-molybdenum cofactor biosynthesis protein NifN [Methylocystis sp. MJC1]KAF2992365.1 Nitrogenase molybdenum-iron protein beta chain [Methylocystis sp. MJC1]MBU6527501.1 nitrogenase iron-molybdenum cofactor biosynthesis protein NifN [Methylocystis sp. MJC1]UZX10446.1 nitrogenase iron-molybdenum cofactor biosynthesis protein NifN [Methylocystis sp. MJC1]
MARVTVSKKSCAVNPLKMSQPIGGALAFMGVSGCMPVLHGSQGCTSFGLVLFVRHFKEAIPLQTTAMNEVATVLGGLENIEQAILNIVKRAKPKVIGICSTGVTETKGDDVDGYLQLVRKRHPELDDIGMVYVSTPDFKDAFQDGFGKTVTKLIEAFVPDEIPSRRAPQRVNVLAGCHLTPGDIDELRDIIEAFGLEPTFLPDLSGSLDGHIPDDFTPTTLGGVTKEDIAAMGSAAWTIAVGEQMREGAEALQSRAGVPFQLFDRLTGLAPNDELIGLLSRISGRPVPIKFRRQRGQLVDAMLDGHFHFGGKRIAIGAEPDLLFAISQWLTEMGAEVTAAVTTTHSPVLEKIMTEEVLIGDLEDLENRLSGCDLMITHSHGRQASERSGVPLYRMGLPMFDRIGAAHELSVGYRGTRDLIFKLGNLFIDQVPEPTPETWRGESAEHDGTTLASENDIAPISAH